MDLNNFDLSCIQRIGLDKVQFSGFAVASIDIHMLSQNTKTEIHLAGSKSRRCKRHMPSTKVGITKITIKDNQIFSDLIIGCADTSGGRLVEYVYLTITVDNAKGCNLENMSYQKYDDYIACTLDYICSEYGIVLIADEMKIFYMEINANILLKNQFSQYNRVLKLLISLFNNHLGKLNTYEKITGNKCSKAESYTRGNQSTEIIFYDKTKELEDKKQQIDDDASILRIELKLKNRQKIKSVFGTSYWKELDNKKIAGYYHSQIYTQLFNKFNNWQQTRNGELKKLIAESRQQSKKTWHHILMQEIRNKTELQNIPYILDIEQVCSAFKQIPDPNRNSSRSVKSLMNICISDDVYKNHDTDRVYEILNALYSYFPAG